MSCSRGSRFIMLMSLIALMRALGLTRLTFSEPCNCGRERERAVASKIGSLCVCHRFVWLKEQCQAINRHKHVIILLYTMGKLSICFLLASFMQYIKWIFFFKLNWMLSVAIDLFHNNKQDNRNFQHNVKNKSKEKKTIYLCVYNCTHTFSSSWRPHSRSPPSYYRSHAENRQTYGKWMPFF